MIIYFIGLRRSGNHGLFEWMYPQMGSYYHINNIDPINIKSSLFTTNCQNIPEQTKVISR